jgi:hypothetical protein
VNEYPFDDLLAFVRGAYSTSAPRRAGCDI